MDTRPDPTLQGIMPRIAASMYRVPRRFWFALALLCVWGLLLASGCDSGPKSIAEKEAAEEAETLEIYIYGLFGVLLVAGWIMYPIMFPTARRGRQEFYRNLAQNIPFLSFLDRSGGAPKGAGYARLAAMRDVAESLEDIEAGAKRGKDGALVVGPDWGGLYDSGAETASGEALDKRLLQQAYAPTAAAAYDAQYGGGVDVAATLDPESFEAQMQARPEPVVRAPSGRHVSPHPSGQHPAARQPSGPHAAAPHPSSPQPVLRQSGALPVVSRDQAFGALAQAHALAGSDEVTISRPGLDQDDDADETVMRKPLKPPGGPHYE